MYRLTVSMRAVVIGTILAFAHHTMADPGTLVDKLMGKAFMPAVATPQGANQLLVRPGALGVRTDGAPIANLPVRENFKLNEVATMPGEIFQLEGTAQRMPIDAHWKTMIYGCFGYGMGAVVLLSIIYKFVSKWNRGTPGISTSPLDGADLQSSAAIALPLVSSNGELRTSGVVMQAGAGLMPAPAGVGQDLRRPIPGGPDPFIHVQGQSLRTWSFPSADPEQVQVVLRTEGRPLDAAVELWHGPDNTPTVMRVYVEDGFITPFSAVIATPRSPNTVAVRNIGQVEFPLSANIFANDIDVPTPECLESAVTVQGGAVRTFAFAPTIDSVQVLLTTDGRPLNARIELLQGPTNEKQIIELYNDDGMERPFFGIFNSPGSGSVIRIVNTGPIEFPMSASVVPYS